MSLEWVGENHRKQKLIRTKRSPFVRQHGALTPAQRKYLCSVAASCSTDHVRNVIAQHYRNVLHTRIRAGEEELRQSWTCTWSLIPNQSKELPSKPKPQFPSGTKLKGKRNASAKHVCKTNTR
uniref:Uncharacterized protein n=1 Tax=Echeneis naucrates TaxID=173247 RepID=A0A665X1Q1_ECHNA